MLNTNQSCQSLSAFANMHNLSVAVFSHMWRLLHHIVSHPKGWVPYEDKCIMYYVSSQTIHVDILKNISREILNNSKF